MVDKMSVSGKERHRPTKELETNAAFMGQEGSWVSFSKKVSMGRNPCENQGSSSGPSSQRSHPTATLALPT